MGIWDIFGSKAQKLCWKRLRPEQIEPRGRETVIDADKAYFFVRLKEMYISETRKLWRKMFPLVHGFVAYSGKEEHAVAGPGQLKELGEANLDRIITLNYPLAGPIAYKGGDLNLLVGLYSVPGEDATRILIDMVGQVASLGGLALGPYPQIATAIKTGVENLVGINSARLELGVRDTFYPKNLLREGYYVGINAPEAEIPFGLLWLRDGRLVKGADPIAGRPYEDYDYFVLEIERRDRRVDWPGLPGMAAMQEKFAAVMRDTLAVPEKRQRLAALWPEFQQLLADSAFLVGPDREQIANDVSLELKKRLEALETGNPFETRAWGDSHPVRREPGIFDFLDVPEYLNRANPKEVGAALLALAGNPFQG
jgi:hypothetical protein